MTATSGTSFDRVMECANSARDAARDVLEAQGLPERKRACHVYDAP